MFKNIAEVKKANKAAGQKWFNAATMRFFNTVIESSLLTYKGRQFFITSDRMELEDEKRFALREVLSNGAIKTHGNVRDYATGFEAREAIRKVLK